jgi:hypothetical protein
MSYWQQVVPISKAASTESNFQLNRSTANLPGSGHCLINCQLDSPNPQGWLMPLPGVLMSHHGWAAMSLAALKEHASQHTKFL